MGIVRNEPRMDARAARAAGLGPGFGLGLALADVADAGGEATGVDDDDAGEEAEYSHGCAYELGGAGPGGTGSCLRGGRDDDEDALVADIGRGDVGADVDNAARPPPGTLIVCAGRDRGCLDPSSSPASSAPCEYGCDDAGAWVVDVDVFGECEIV